MIDLGKTHGRLLVFSRDGSLLQAQRWTHRSQNCAGGYLALDVVDTGRHLMQAFQALGTLAAQVVRVIVSAHGAAIAGLQQPPSTELAFEVPDYEWTGFDARDPTLAAQLDPFSQTLCPLLPQGLNIGVQLDWLERNHPQALARTATLLPYSQYWSWWLSGQAASEVSALGCHTLLWQPHTRGFSRWARDRGWAQRIAPLRNAWDELGPVRPARAAALGLQPDTVVHVGVHDSNACLAAHLHHWSSLTLVSSGTWVVVMSTGAPPGEWRDVDNQLANVSVQGQGVATARFMGGRDVGVLCAGANPDEAAATRLIALLQRGLMVLPGFQASDAACSQPTDALWLDGGALALQAWCVQLEPADRATAAALYLGLMTASLILSMQAREPVVVDGPMAHNATALQVLVALLPQLELYRSVDEAEGTARGAWRLAHWHDKPSRQRTERLGGIDPAWRAAVATHYRDWQARRRARAHPQVPARTTP